MKEEFDVTITKYFAMSCTITIEAEDEEQAQALAEKAYYEGAYDSAFKPSREGAYVDFQVEEY